MSDDKDLERPLSPAELRDLWNFDDAAASAERFAAAAADVVRVASQRAELATQQARALGLQGKFAQADAVLDAIGDPTGVAGVRVLLERGRLRNSAGDVTAAVQLFGAAAEAARAVGAEHLTVDALHMLAIADAGHEQDWTDRALDVVARTTDPETRRWSVALHNNLGWHLHDVGRLEQALEEFELAHRASLEVGDPEQESVARWAIARCLRSLGRNSRALAMQRQLLVDRPEDPYVREEVEVLEGLEAGGDSSTT
ncbi:tetratricopeptide repeat protein [Pengzhenrongella sp.]|jgi:tetratricopeptide (TPR) repeat protein|uniref:tetratricopeptide repeat protein n=1 Tax=Pengzhenrongella sp. TaxID=2888820 RepID=UPI002F92643A